MGWGVHILVTFPCDGPLGVAELAQRFLLSYHYHPDEQRPNEVIRQFLAFLAAGKGINCGTKGGRFTWGIVGNGTDANIFVELLRPFWAELLGRFSPPLPVDWEGPFYYESVLVFYEAYEVGHASLIEIRNIGDWRSKQVNLIIEKLPQLPFTLIRSNEYEPTFAP